MTKVTRDPDRIKESERTLQRSKEEKESGIGLHQPEYMGVR